MSPSEACSFVYKILSLKWLWVDIRHWAEIYSTNTDMGGLQKPMRFIVVHKNTWRAYGTNDSYMPYTKPFFS